MAETISWFATAATILAATVTASNLGTRITGYGFIIFLLGSLAWLAVAALTGQKALLWTNLVLTGLNIFGIWRWLGRKAKIEEGGKSAQQASRETPGEPLFPDSILGGATISDADGQKVGQTVDAMIGSHSGRIAYLAATSGGVAGIAETLRRVDWRDAHFSEGGVTIRLSKDEFERLRSLPKDQWPGA